MMPSRLLGVCVISVVVFFACSDSTDPGEVETETPPDPGVVRVRLVSPHGNDGALKFVVTGGELSNINHAAAFLVQSTNLETGGWRFIVMGSIGSDDVVTFQVPDRNKLDGYVLTLEEVAARDTYERRDPSGYRIDILK